MTFDILNPVDTSGTSINNSVVLAFSYGAIDFLFTGDAEQEAESSMVEACIVPEVEILKVGHHGSNSSSSSSFLAATSPEIAIYMAGEDNT